MVHSRGGVSGGLTIADALREFESRGYVGQFAIAAGGFVHCVRCGADHRPADVRLESGRRVEGVSDPADMVFIGALRCPNCGQTGTAIMSYGPNAPPEDATVLRALDDHRRSNWLSHGEDSDRSLVSDSGWLIGPDG
ncbi:MAG TPA: hypothetical protein VM370_02315 [Candidatus Thermoplasmatota archaeon]|nr:hypothetical protein [Candidatus Thermoplasmatota archaeon]